MLWYSSEAPRRGASDEYHNICFHGEITKVLCGYPILSGTKISIHAVGSKASLFVRMKIGYCTIS